MAVGVGDGTSFEAFVRVRSDRLLRLAWLVTGNWDDARDAVQDALEGVMARWGRLAASEKLDAYVHRCVVNACLATIRRRGRSRPVAEPQLLPQAKVVADPASAIANADEAWRLCTGLPPVQRAAVVLRFYQDLSFAEIGATLGCPEATARSQPCVRVSRKVRAMDEAERAFRDALHRVDSVKIPMPSLEAGEVRRSRGRGLVVGRWLAAAAALALVAGLGVWALSVRGLPPTAVPAAPASTAPRMPQLTGAAWGALELFGQAVAASGTQVPFVVFAKDSTFTGGDPCNHVGGTYRLVGDELLLSRKGDMTEMGCNVTQQGQFLKVLDGTRRAERTGDTLVLRDASGTVLGTFRAMVGQGEPGPTATPSTPTPSTPTPTRPGIRTSRPKGRNPRPRSRTARPQRWRYASTTTPASTSPTSTPCFPAGRRCTTGRFRRARCPGMSRSSGRTATAT